MILAITNTNEKLIREICAKYDDIPESTLENFFKESEEHANFLIDCVKVK